MGGGITQLPMNQMMVPRGQYGLGSIVKSITKPIKKAVSAVGDFAKSDVGKMALLAAGGYYLGGGALMGGPGFSFGQLGTSLASPFKALGPKLLGTVEAGTGLYGGGLFSGAANALSGAGISSLIPSKGALLSAGLGFLGGAATSMLTPQQIEVGMKRNPTAVRQYLAQYYKNLNPEATEEEAEQYANEQTREYAAEGGRIGFEEGGILSLEEAKKLNPGMFVDTTTYNPIPEDAPNMAADEIARVMLGIRGLPREEGEIEDTETMSTQEFMFNKYLKPKRKELMENFGLTMKEADDLIREGMSKIRDKKAGGGMPMGIMRTNQAGVKERDYREDGGFVPVGIKEKADDVPAMLSKNEFVFTADAVRGAGNGDVEKGAERLYNTMKTLENGGTV